MFAEEKGFPTFEYRVQLVQCVPKMTFDAYKVKTKKRFLKLFCNLLNRIDCRGRMTLVDKKVKKSLSSSFADAMTSYF